MLPAELSISKEQARLFLARHHRLLPPRKLVGKQGVIDYVRHVNCIQYDPINVVGQNPHLVLQSRVKGYKPAMLDEALYSERKLIDGYDKAMSIYPIGDWPFFARYREHMGTLYASHESTVKAAKMMKWVKKEIEARGPLSSLDLEDETRMEWWLSGSTRAVRIALDILFTSGEIVVHHRAGTRRYFDLSKRLVPRKYHNGRELHSDAQSYMDWHVLRRIGSLGLARYRNAGQWEGLQRWMRLEGSSRRVANLRLLEQGGIVRVEVEGMERQEVVMHRADLPELENVKKSRIKQGAAFIAPLDNLMWDRDLLEQLFDFFYRWEVYVPAPKRRYGYYVLPVLYGDRLIARLDPAFDRARKTFTIQNWWWQPGVDKKDGAMLIALQDCVKDFVKYLGASDVKLGDVIKKDRLMKEVIR